MLKTLTQSNLPREAIVLFPDGDKLCAVGFDFENIQESPAGFGDDVKTALLSLRQDLLEEKTEIDKRLASVSNAIDGVNRSGGMSDFQIAMERNSRHVATWPEWKRNILGACLDGKASNPTPRTPVDNNGDDGGF